MNAKSYPVIFLVLLFASCTVYKEYPIEIYNPGEASVPAEAKSAALVYRNFKFEEDTLQHYYKSNYQLFRAKNDPANLDSILVTACLNELAANLKANNAFQKLFVFPFSTFDKHSAKHLSELTPELTEKVAGASNADVLIVLETFSSFFSTYPEEFETPKSNEVITVAVWGIYDPESRTNIDRKTMIDTVFWNGYDTEGNYQRGYNPPPRLTALELASALAGENYAKRFYASWQTVNRMYSVPPLPDFSTAAQYLEEGKWDESIKLWEKYADQSNGKMAIHARYNLALAYEMKDDLEAAQKWLTAALDLALSYNSKSDLKMILAYKKVLAARQSKILKFSQDEKLP
ncbi:hypothetical protein SAMN05444274_10289 [Mariniphaga anaerophila]|uniref:Tetratricopeptide repeat-containing protein n=1 Tax=Mariniphaga anaerophila TaxID=1484053 RepID=A0A1M4VFY1_9BACT|nr:DUF6340 family protein [Mariniphaga anaerophila]SHE67889.1 hypothetical protein SAMN05444274_10289 [Mariniphaga anaerophila]